ncbi:10348_t:CDS:10 [Ambispora gerdemannii]|uniref:10348_t:CDS:1 n=1 Tax=Ambispora gerdemannii TaxID=144530 RepID=A0A9N8ZEZ1_9GLOM|nr:10348_t:CDS:10 [Ambispora gerdemannii]
MTEPYWRSPLHLSTSVGGGPSNNTAYPTFGFASPWSETPARNQAMVTKRDFLKIELNNPMNALSASPDQTRVVVGGHQGTYLIMLKTFRVTEKGAEEEMNLRYRNNDNKQSINDVKWGNQHSKNKIAAASNNGYILLWDVGGGRGKLDRTIGEQGRAINKICVNPMQGSLMLCALQDWTIQMWDLRDRGRAKVTFHGRANSVRDVQFHPSNSTEFIAAFDNGMIQKWDIRKPNLYEKRLFAHTNSALTVDWHPDGNKVASGGVDKTIKIWDMNSDDNKPTELIPCIAGVARVQWRPNQVDEIASCSFKKDNRIFIWNIKRPYIASYFFDEHEDTPTGILWHDTHVLWSCSKDRTFIQQDIRTKSHRQIDLLNKCGIGWNVYDRLAFAIDKPAVEDNSILDDLNQIRRSQRRLSPGASDSGVLEIALKSQKYRSSQTWKIVQLLFSKDTLEKTEDEEKKLVTNSDNSNLTLFKNKSINASPKISTKSLGENNNNNTIQNVDHPKEKVSDGMQEIFKNEDSLSESEESDEFVTDENREKENIPATQPPPHSNLIKMTSKLVQPTLKSAVRLVWDHEPIMDSLLEYYAEQGDVQMCVTLVLVLNEKLKVDEDCVERWLFSYIELLHRFQLWIPASAIISSCKIPSVRVKNQEATTIYTTCNNCFKPIINSHNGFWVCDKCQKLLNPCSTCHQIVKGLYSWCQGCGHGGHLAHMSEWFQKSAECPTGCGHYCVHALFDKEHS